MNRRSAVRSFETIARCIATDALVLTAVTLFGCGGQVIDGDVSRFQGVSPSAKATRGEYYVGWSGGTIGVTDPISGTKLTNATAAPVICAQTLGAGFRMAEFHDGMWITGMGKDRYFGNSWPTLSVFSSGGWSWYAFGNVPSNTRFWVYINDKRANCWD